MQYPFHSRQESITIILRYCQEIEATLGMKLGLKGTSLNDKINWDQGRLPNELKQKIIRMIRLGERAMSDPRFEIQDLENFSQKCDLVLQELNQLAEQFYENPFKYNIIYLVQSLWVGLLLFWLCSLYIHSQLAALPQYKLIFWSSFGASLGASLFLGLMLKSRRYYQAKMDLILQKILILILMLNPLTLPWVTIALFLLNRVN
jgi:hypothetical protein